MFWGLESDDAITDTVGSEEIFESATGLNEVEEVFEGLIALEMEFRVVCPNVFTDFERYEEVEGGSFALNSLERRGRWRS
jgi:hypothetical protein